MSVQAMAWVFDHSNTTGVYRLVLLAVANHADPRGENSWANVETLAHEARCSVRMAQYALRKLAADGEIAVTGKDPTKAANRAGATYCMPKFAAFRGAGHCTPDRKSGVQDIAPQQTAGVQSLQPRGAIHDTPGVQTATSRTPAPIRESRANVNRPLEPSLKTNVNVRAHAHEEEETARRIGEQLGLMTGSRSEPESKNHRFHLRIARTLPEPLIQEALAATRDAVEDQRAGKKTLRNGPGAYFTGVIRRIAEREGINLGLSTRSVSP